MVFNIYTWFSLTMLLSHILSHPLGWIWRTYTSSLGYAPKLLQSFEYGTIVPVEKVWWNLSTCVSWIWTTFGHIAIRLVPNQIFHSQIRRAKILEDWLMSLCAWGLFLVHSVHTFLVSKICLLRNLKWSPEQQNSCSNRLTTEFKLRPISWELLLAIVSILSS